MANTKEAEFWHVGTRSDALKAFAKQLRAKKVYILRCDAILNVPDPAGSKWRKIKWKIKYVTGRDAERIVKQLSSM